ncbi:MAG TPA: hypothetical protein VIA07_02615 [Desulfuromonadales bacterium]|jgi:uncharacterized protein YjbJ (UPF0337 family)
MNAVLVRGQLNQFRGTFKTGICRLTGNDAGRMSGQMLRLLGKAQVKYGRVMTAAGKRIKKITRH